MFESPFTMLTAVVAGLAAVIVFAETMSKRNGGIISISGRRPHSSAFDPANPMDRNVAARDSLSHMLNDGYPLADVTIRPSNPEV